MSGGGLPEPVLLSNLLNVGAININGHLIHTAHIFYTWLAMVFLFTLGFIVRKKLTMVPGTLQNVLETIVDGLESFTISNIGEAGRKIFPLLCTIFMFILTMNLMGLIPFMDAPTANINTNAAMALFVFAYYNFYGLKKHGFEYGKQFLGPSKVLIPLMLPIEIVSHVARPISLTLRLFGNIKGEEIVLIVFFSMLPLLSTLPIYFLFGFAKTLQAFIFYMLTLIYLKGAIEGAH